MSSLGGDPENYVSQEDFWLKYGNKINSLILVLMLSVMIILAIWGLNED